MKKSHKRVLIAIIVLIALGYYTWLLFLRSWEDLGLNAHGRAVAAAINVAFGQEDYFKEQQEFAAIAKQKIKDECRTINQTLPQYCLVGSAYTKENIYYRHCAGLENCAPITIDPVLLKYSDLRTAVQQVIANPCKYLPNNEEVTAAKEQEREIRGKNGASYVTHLIEYDHAWNDLGCGKPANETLKVIIGISNTDKSLAVKTKMGK